jgi:uncharacterized protein (DUF488 family)
MMDDTNLKGAAKMKKVYTIGYQGMNIDEFIRALKAHGIEMVMDVRSKPASRNSSFRKKALQQRLAREGFRYTWKGETLGGFSEIRESHLLYLTAALEELDLSVCLMCMEADPRKCHRHHEIAERLKKYGVRTSHIIKDGDGTREEEV